MSGSIKTTIFWFNLKFSREVTTFCKLRKEAAGRCGRSLEFTPHWPPTRHRVSLCQPAPRARGHLGGRLGPGQASWFGPALNLLPLLRVQATEAEGAEGVMAPEKHPGKRQERKGAAESPPQGHARLRHLQPGTFWGASQRDSLQPAITFPTRAPGHKFALLSWAHLLRVPQIGVF